MQAISEETCLYAANIGITAWPMRALIGWWPRAGSNTSSHSWWSTYRQHLQTLKLSLTRLHGHPLNVLQIQLSFHQQLASKTPYWPPEATGKQQLLLHIVTRLSTGTSTSLCNAIIDVSIPGPSQLWAPWLDKSHELGYTNDENLLMI